MASKLMGNCFNYTFINLFLIAYARSSAGSQKARQPKGVWLLIAVLAKELQQLRTDHLQIVATDVFMLRFLQCQ
jgi:hypothetical protein